MGAILRACAECGTPFAPKSARDRWCALHTRTGNEHRSPTTRTRPSSSTERERIRQQVLARDPLCQLRIDDGCTVTSTVADHKVPAEHGGRYTLDNLQGACHHCNSVRGGQRVSSLQHGRDGGSGGPSSVGGGRSAPVGATRLA